jgi:hypothetical protein
MKTTTTKYHCDKCGKELPTFKNSLNIVISKLHVRIQHRPCGETYDADVCQPCAIALLEDALKRVKAGERATKGSESIYEERWEGVQ